MCCGASLYCAQDNGAPVGRPQRRPGRRAAARRRPPRAGRRRGREAVITGAGLVSSSVRVGGGDARQAGYAAPRAGAFARKPTLGLEQRVWLHDGGLPTFGALAYELVDLVERTGSLHQAAKSVGMGYGRALRTVRESEERLGIALLDRRAGGAGGGGSRLTDDARLLLHRYAGLVRDADEALQALFAKHFGDLPLTDAPRTAAFESPQPCAGGELPDDR